MTDEQRNAIRAVVADQGAFEVLMEVACWMHDDWPTGDNAKLRPDLIPKMQHSANEIVRIAKGLLL